jgi:hypothetical protein
MKAFTKFALAVIGLALLIGAVSTQAQQPLTGPQILQKVEEKGGMGGTQGELISDVKFDIIGKDKKTATNEFRFFWRRKKGEPDKLLVAFVKPDDVRGTLFLSIKPENKDADLWLYLPALGAVKQLVNTQERKGSFAGSNLSFEDLGSGFKYSESYNADEKVTEEKIKIGDKEYNTYVLTLRVKKEKRRPKIIRCASSGWRRRSLSCSRVRATTRQTNSRPSLKPSRWGSSRTTLCSIKCSSRTCSTAARRQSLSWRASAQLNRCRTISSTRTI